MLDKAIELAKIAHEGQVDKAGKPYIDHPLRVMNNVETVEEKIVAVLHDAVEDSDLTLEDLTVAGFSNIIIEAIAAITKLEGETAKDYLNRVMDNPLALKVAECDRPTSKCDFKSHLRAVKIADMTDNANISRIPNPTDKDRERTRIYKKNILKLQKKLKNYAR